MLQNLLLSLACTVRITRDAINSGYTKIYSNYDAFAALKADGSITAWGDPNNGGKKAPIDKSSFVPPLIELPQATIEPSDLRAAKAPLLG
jgi:hypothetical protein